MGKPTLQHYADQLDKMERLRESGQISSGLYEVHRHRLLAEVSAQPAHWALPLVGILALITLVLLILGVLIGIVFPAVFLSWVL